jgi:hypothetical protein
MLRVCCEPVANLQAKLLMDSNVTGLQRAMQFVVLSRTDIKGVLPKSKSEEKTLSVGETALLNARGIAGFHVAAPNAFGALCDLGNTPSSCAPASGEIKF